MSTINIEQFEKIVEFNIDNNIKRAILDVYKRQIWNKCKVQ